MISPVEKKGRKLFHLYRDQNKRRNPYGMIRQADQREDDHKAFISIQAERYLKRKTVHRFCSDAERDVILQIIDDSWGEFIKQRNLGQMDTDQKIRSFYSLTLVFPYFVAEEESLISVDFRSKKEISSRDTCCCGSNLPYRQCCGGILSLDELLNGPK